MLIITMIRKIQKPITTVQELCIIGSAAVRLAWEYPKVCVNLQTDVR